MCNNYKLHSVIPNSNNLRALYMIINKDKDNFEILDGIELIPFPSFAIYELIDSPPNIIQTPLFVEYENIEMGCSFIQNPFEFYDKEHFIDFITEYEFNQYFGNNRIIMKKSFQFKQIMTFIKENRREYIYDLISIHN